MSFNNLDLVKYAEFQIGNPYWYGTFGNIASAALYKEKSSQYPSKYNKWSKESFIEQYGQKVHDCCGLIKGYLMTPNPLDTPYAPAVYNPKYDLSANGMMEACETQGAISLLQEIPGIIVWKNNHVGIYVGNGYVIEAKGHSYGVIKSRLEDTKWVKWGMLPWISYERNPEPEPKEVCEVKLPVLRRGMKDVSVLHLQWLLFSWDIRDNNGRTIDRDGSFGPKTEYCVKEFQRKMGLVQDGVVGSKTWTKIIEG